MKALTVVQPFGNHQRGSQITDEAEIEKILASEQANNVVVVELPIVLPHDEEEHENPPPAAE